MTDTKGTEQLRYCPACGQNLESIPSETEAWVECPIHGEIHVEFYRP